VASAFRIAQVGSTGGITLKAVTLNGGHAATAGHNNGASGNAPQPPRAAAKP
jgi:hypothetical protein